MASESHTVCLAVDEAGHLAGGRKVGEAVRAEDHLALAKGIASSFISTQGRSDQEE